MPSPLQNVVFKDCDKRFMPSSRGHQLRDDDVSGPNINGPKPFYRWPSNPPQMRRNYIFNMTMPERGLAREKIPPLCDGCGRASFMPDKNRNYTVSALVLNNGLWGLVCDDCIKRHFSKIAHFKEAEASEAAKIALHGTLSSSPKFSIFGGLH